MPPGLVGEHVHAGVGHVPARGRSVPSSASAAWRAAIGGMLIAKVAGYVLQATGSYYVPMFIVAASAYLVALAVMHLLAPRLEPAQLAAQR